MPPGLYPGSTGIAWAVEHLQSDLEVGLDDSNVEIDEALVAFVDGAKPGGNFDLLGGFTGIGVYALERARRASGRQLLARVVERLRELAEPRGPGVAWRTPPENMWSIERERYPAGYFNLGVAHGAPAVALVLAAACALEVGDAQDLLEGAMRWLLGRRRDAESAFVFPAIEVCGGGPSLPSRASWCYGNPGVAVTLLATARAVENPEWEEAALAAAARAAARPHGTCGVKDAGVCHGAAGLALLFHRLWQATDDARFADAARRWYAHTLDLHRPGEGTGGYFAWAAPDSDPMKHDWIPNRSLLCGAAGIGLVLLAGLGIEPSWDSHAGRFVASLGDGAMTRSKPTETPVVVPAGFFVLRTPLLPIDELMAWSADLAAPAAGDDSVRLADAVARDVHTLRTRLRAIVSRPDVREALFVASPSLEESLPIWLAQPESARGRKVERTLVRYFVRMTSRATPFGLFAGCSLGTIADETRLGVGDRSGYRRHTRIDGDYLASLIAALGDDPRFRQIATYRPNSSLYRLGGQIRYVEPRVSASGRSYRLTAVEPDAPLEATLERAAAGARLGELAQALVDEEITRADADDFITQLVDSRLLISDLEPKVTGEEPLDALIDTLSAAAPSHVEVAAVARQLGRVQAAVRALDAAPLGADPAVHRAIADLLAPLPATLDPSCLLQVDLMKPPLEATLGTELLAELQRVVALLHPCALPSQGLESFRQAFERRYDTREVPLAEVLDEELGIGFERSDAPSRAASPLLEGFRFGAPGAREASTGPFFTVLLDRLTAALRDGAEEIILDEDDLAKMAATAAATRGTQTPPPLPDSLAALVTVAGAAEPGAPAGDFQLVLHALGGPSGAIALGRFCHADERLHELVRAHLAVEEARYPDALVAEIVHLPEGRASNVMVRPQLREWEIVYLGHSGAPTDKQLGLDDLLVSVRDGRVVLRSRRHQREVVPRLTSAHRFGHPRHLGAYRFLGALQNQGMAMVGFHWASLESAPYLPRVRVGRTVLSLARWRLEAGELRPIVETTGAARFAHVQQLRRAHRLPRWVAVTDGDQVLPIDLENVLSLEAHGPAAQDRPSVLFTELFGHDGPCSGPDGRFVQELVVPLLSTQARTPTPAAAPAPSRVRRRCAPGSEWLYAKLYTGEATADAILRDVIAPVVSDSRARGAAAAWFFLRYSDPDSHLRVRFFGDPARLREEVLPSLESAVEAALVSGRVWRFQLDTYEREVERYGGDAGILASERLFCADSDAVLTLLDALPADDLDARWRITLRAIDLLLDDLALSLTDKHRLLQSLAQGFRREFRADGPLARQIGERFRAHRTSLEALLEGDGIAAGDRRRARASFGQHIAPIAAELRRRVNAGQLRVSLADLSACYLHVHANRMLPGAARAQELVLYDFLERLYQGRLARAKAA